jgi:uncharacterized protein (TIGR03083 family)
MATIVDRDRAVALLRAEFDAVAALGATLDEDAWNTATCLPGWTVKDNLAHMYGTESSLAGHPLPDVAVTDAPHLKNDIAKSNEQWIESVRALPGAEVLARFRTVADERLAALDAMSQADFDAPSWTPAGPDETYGRFMRIRFYDCFLHEHDMRDALGLPDRDDPEPVAFAVEEVEPGLGYIVGRKAAMPKGSRIALHLTGAVEHTYLVAVDDRAAVVDAFDGEPTVSLTMPVMLFLRLTGGRTVADAHAGEIAYAGDDALGHQLAGSLAFTI